MIFGRESRGEIFPNETRYGCIYTPIPCFLTKHLRLNEQLMKYHVDHNKKATMNNNEYTKN